jgi:palmitoyltransferase ZDHHC9/14/18
MTAPDRSTSPHFQDSSAGATSQNPLEDSINDAQVAALALQTMDVGSDDGDGAAPGRGQPSKVQGQTGPPGEAGLPPSRPSSFATVQSSKRRSWGQPPPSRRGYIPAFGASSASGSVGGGSIRPGTASSKTHIPSLTPNAFFRPMSSQRLQAQRGQRPPSGFGNRNEGASDSRIGSFRHSDGRGTPLGHYDHDGPSPPSRGTDVTAEMPDRTTANTSPTGAETVRSHPESVAPLHQEPHKPQHLDLSKATKDRTGGLPTPGKSPRSFRSSFILPSRGAASSTRPQGQGHEKLSSTASSPRFAQQEALKQEVKKELGKNHEYFSGNIVFCWGGRLQNTRDRPVNIATGLLFILPAALFFGFS